MLKFMKTSFFSLYLISLLKYASPVPTDLNEEKWTDLLQGEWMVEFYAPWCPACQQLEPIWNEFAGSSEEMNIRVAKVDVTKNPGLSGRFGITALPTIFHVKDSTFRQYRGGKTKDALVQFVMKEQWKKLDPLPFWKSPQSFLMSSSSLLYRMSVLLKDAYNMMLDLGMPVWAIICIFVASTMLLGVLLGFILVLIIDICSRFMYPRHVKRNQNLETEVSTVTPNEPAASSEKSAFNEGQDQTQSQIDTEQEWSEDKELLPSESCDSESSETQSESVDSSSGEGTVRRRAMTANNDM